jgi:hypothetical protein
MSAVAIAPLSASCRLPLIFGQTTNECVVTAVTNNAMPRKQPTGCRHVYGFRVRSN